MSSFCQLPQFDFLAELLYAFTNLLTHLKYCHLLFYVVNQLLLVSLSHRSFTCLETFFLHEIVCARYCSLPPREYHYHFCLFLVFCTISFLDFVALFCAKFPTFINLCSSSQRTLCPLKSALQLPERPTFLKIFFYRGLFF